MHPLLRAFALTSIVPLFGCGASADGATGGAGGPAGSDKQPPSATAATLLRDIRESKAKVVISERKPTESGLGKIAMSVDGKPVWPPHGDECGALVTCCDHQQATDDRFALLCQFALVRDRECKAAMRTVSQVASELNQTMDRTCAE